MPRVIDNEDGTKTLTVNSSELHALKDFIDDQVPDFKRVLQIVEGSGVRRTLDFVKSVVSP
jgi:hypothetical protein